MSDGRVRRAHEMPFGAALEPGGSARFRLWAPGASRVELCLGRDADVATPMTSAGDGWWEAAAAEAAAGTPYRYRIDGQLLVPDPASRAQADDVHGPSLVVDPATYAWRDGDWRGRPWEEAVLYEMHVGCFTPEGSFRAAISRLDHLRDLGITAIELMPVADFPGRRNWGYDGVLPFAPDRAYGTPDELKAFVDAAHARGLMVLLDVVYNHFGPDGNYLWVYAKPFFTERHRTPWGAAIDYDGPSSRTVRDFFIHNALYWIEEYGMDGLRLDAVHAICDDSSPTFLEELAAAVRDGPGRRRAVHLVLENDDNAARLLRRDPGGAPAAYVAQWNDDVHHALHVALTGERGGYYGDYAGEPARHLGRALAEGFAWQGEPSTHRDGRRRGEPSVRLPPTAFVPFLQNHDQVGNRAFGERLTVLVDERPLHAALAVLLLSPQPPLLFMGEEIGCEQPFPFFCDHAAELARTVTEGRRLEFARWPEFRDPAARRRIPDPNAESTFRSAVLESLEPMTDAERRWLTRYRRLLGVRRREIVPLLARIGGAAGTATLVGNRGLEVDWRLDGGGRLALRTVLGDRAIRFDGPPAGDVLYASDPACAGARLDGWTTVWSLDGGGTQRVARDSAVAEETGDRAPCGSESVSRRSP